MSFEKAWLHRAKCDHGIGHEVEAANGRRIPAKVSQGDNPGQQFSLLHMGKCPPLQTAREKPLIGRVPCVGRRVIIHKRRHCGCRTRLEIIQDRSRRSPVDSGTVLDFGLEDLENDRKDTRWSSMGAFAPHGLAQGLAFHHRAQQRKPDEKAVADPRYAFGQKITACLEVRPGENLFNMLNFDKFTSSFQQVSGEGPAPLGLTDQMKVSI